MLKPILITSTILALTGSIGSQFYIQKKTEQQYNEIIDTIISNPQLTVVEQSMDIGLFSGNARILLKLSDDSINTNTDSKTPPNLLVNSNIDFNILNSNIDTTITLEGEGAEEIKALVSKEPKLNAKTNLNILGNFETDFKIEGFEFKSDINKNYIGNFGDVTGKVNVRKNGENLDTKISAILNGIRINEPDHYHLSVDNIIINENFSLINHKDKDSSYYLGGYSSNIERVKIDYTGVDFIANDISTSAKISEHNKFPLMFFDFGSNFSIKSILVNKKIIDNLSFVVDVKEINKDGFIKTGKLAEKLNTIKVNENAPFETLNSILNAQQENLEDIVSHGLKIDEISAQFTYKNNEGHAKTNMQIHKGFKPDSPDALNYISADASVFIPLSWINEIISVTGTDDSINIMEATGFFVKKQNGYELIVKIMDGKMMVNGKRYF